MVRKVVVPAAGLGTRLFPATKEQPKEMFPIFSSLVNGEDGSSILRKLPSVRNTFFWDPLSSKFSSDFQVENVFRLSGARARKGDLVNGNITRYNFSS